jgi:hypothetical protein
MEKSFSQIVSPLANKAGEETGWFNPEGFAKERVLPTDIDAFCALAPKAIARENNETYNFFMCLVWLSMN